MRSLAIAVASLFAFSALAFAQDSVKSTSIMHPKAPPGAKVFIVSPTDGATVAADVHVVFGIQGIALASTANTAADAGHHHLLIDVTKLPPMNAPIPSDAEHVHFGKGQAETTIHLSPGEHTLQLDLGNFAHMQFDPPIVSKKITIHVK